MRRLPLFRRRQSATYSEARRLLTGTEVAGSDGSDMEIAVDDAPPAVADYDVWEDRHGAQAIFGLIGAPVPDDKIRTWHTQDPDPQGTASSHDLIATLYAQYCRALYDPHAPLAGMWAIPEIMSPQEGACVATLNRRPLHADSVADPASTDAGSIEVLLSGARLLTDAFGILEEADLNQLTDTEPVPEILRLFAPGEYQAAARRRPLLLPPTLARREHHMPGIDSPMPGQALTRDDPRFA